MKSWLAKIRLSSALDAGQRPSPSPRAPTNSSDAPRSFKQELTALDGALKAGAPKAQPPASLHRGIMQAVRSANRPDTEAPRLALLRWVVAPLAAALAVLVVLQSLRKPPPLPPHGDQSLAVAVSTIQEGRQLAQAVPSAVVAPLSSELQRLHQDLDNAAQYLLASFP